MNNDLFPNLDVKPDITAENMKSEQEDLIIPESKPEHVPKEMKDQNEIFMTNKKTVNTPPEQMTVTSSDIKKTENGESENKGKYAHLAKARAKGAETRRAKAEAKRKAKEEEKARKAEERAKRREATMERNRQKARERYYKQKELKEAQKKKNDQEFVKSLPQPIPQKRQVKPQSRIQNTPKPSGMDFNTFAQYMMKYEQLKDQYNKQQKSNKKVTVKEPPKEKPYHPKAYPLKHLYGRKTKKQMFS
tara:strand:+ start:9667 stop:10407 length:741 start_codon:yes stop_codon:yes gene_type:complete